MSSKTLLVTRKVNGQTLLTQCAEASSLTRRLVGLLNHSELSENQGMLIQPCKQVHTLFMRFSIDAVFLDKANVVVAIEELKPWRISKMHFRAHKVLELALGMCRKHALQVGEVLELGGSC